MRALGVKLDSCICGTVFLFSIHPGICETNVRDPGWNTKNYERKSTLPNILLVFNLDSGSAAGMIVRIDCYFMNSSTFSLMKDLT